VNGADAYANTFTRNRERHVQRRVPDASDAVSIQCNRFDVDVGEIGTQDSELKTQN